MTKSDVFAWNSDWFIVLFAPVGIGPSNNFRIGFTKEHFHKIIESCSSCHKIQCDWLDTQNQNKRLKQQLSLFNVAAASVALNNNSQYLFFKFSFLFWFLVSRQSH